MSNHFSRFCLTLAIAAVSALSADEGVSVSEEGISSAPTPAEFTPASIPTPTAPIVTTEKAAIAVVEKSFSPFTGRVKAKKVRMRVGADLESRVVKELIKNDLLIITGEKGDFYAVEPPAGTKAYVFRSFVLDGVIEGNRVNVRLEPSLDAPVIAHMNSGDRVNGPISSQNNKWYEIVAPADSHFYVAKEYVEYLGGPEVKTQIDKRKESALQLMEAAEQLTKAELGRPYHEIDLNRIKHHYETVVSDYQEFNEIVQNAKDAIASLQEEYLQKKIDFLETKAGMKPGDDSFELSKNEVSFRETANPTDRMKMWEPVEESLYLTWATQNEEKSIDEFYDEQKQEGATISGIVEAYTTPVKKKPGDFILRGKELPLAYLYSTHINLQDYVGKKVTVVVAPRENNNFAFPAYYVLSVE